MSQVSILFENRKQEIDESAIRKYFNQNVDRVEMKNCIE